MDAFYWTVSHIMSEHVRKMQNFSVDAAHINPLVQIPIPESLRWEILQPNIREAQSMTASAYDNDRVTKRQFNHETSQ